jgi:hypothetical protein
MLKEGATISKRRTWLIRFVGVSLCAYAGFLLTQAILTTHFELGANRRHLVFDLQHGRLHYTAGIILLVAMLALGILVTLLEAFESEAARRRYRIACNVIGGFSIAAILFGYAVQIWRF